MTRLVFMHSLSCRGGCSLGDQCSFQLDLKGIESTCNSTRTGSRTYVDTAQGFVALLKDLGDTF